MASRCREIATILPHKRNKETPVRMSNLFGKSSRSAPADAETASHQLLVRGGFVRQLASGIYSFLPLGFRALMNVEQIVREEMDAAGCQECLMPILHPRDLWEVTGRWMSVGPGLLRLKDRSDRDFCLAFTHEEAFTQAVAAEVQSYRQVPLLLYHIQTKLRDEPRPRGGLLRVREFIMKDSYSFDVDQAGLDVSYGKMLDAYLKIFARCGLKVFAVKADSGVMGGKHSHEVMLESEAGEDHLVLCANGDFAANLEVARAMAPQTPYGAADPGAASLIPTPGIATIEALHRFLDVPANALLKTMLYWADGRLFAAGVPGAQEVNVTKFHNAIGGANEIRPATDREIRDAGLVPGFIGPPLPDAIPLIVDPLIVEGRGFIAGGNAPDTHRRDVVRGRDYTATNVADLQTVRGGDRCPECEGELRVVRGLELGHLFQFGTHPYAAAFHARFLDERGESRVLYSGSYGIGMDRLLAAIVEASHDEKGIMWPPSVAPYHVYLVALNVDRPEIAEAAVRVEREIRAARLEVLYDDRIEAAGVKFGDADLLGMPLRVTISPRTVANGKGELKLRTSRQLELVDLDEIAARAVELLRVHEA